tara:strand:- start:4720 stop:5190 length:471 start_codon:yes stop_codon:yes gene_type:complete
MDLNGFNANDHEPSNSFDPLPADWYKCVISGTEERQTKAMDGSYLMLTIEVIEGAYQGRKIFDRLNLKNKNQTAVEIAQRSLAGICRAIDVPNPKDSIELRDKPLMVKVSVRPAAGGYDASNDVKGYDAASGGSSTVSVEPVAAAASGGSTPPWKR